MKKFNLEIELTEEEINFLINFVPEQQELRLYSEMDDITKSLSQKCVLSIYYNGDEYEYIPSLSYIGKEITKYLIF